MWGTWLWRILDWGLKRLWSRDRVVKQLSRLGESLEKRFHTPYIYISSIDLLTIP